jgi:general secretion pathway protein I
MKPERECGFTLLEVLVALAIVALGMMAVFGQLSQSLSAANHLRNKTLAHWIALNRITELRLADEFPPVREIHDEIEMGNREWRYTLKVSTTPVANLRRVAVSVALADTPDSILAESVGFIGRPLPQESLRQNSGWVVPDPSRGGQSEGLIR